MLLDTGYYIDVTRFLLSVTIVVPPSIASWGLGYAGQLWREFASLIQIMS